MLVWDGVELKRKHLFLIGYGIISLFLLRMPGYFWGIWYLMHFLRHCSLYRILFNIYMLYAMIGLLISPHLFYVVSTCWQAWSSLEVIPTWFISCWKFGTHILTLLCAVVTIAEVAFLRRHQILLAQLASGYLLISLNYFKEPFTNAFVMISFLVIIWDYPVMSL